MKRIFSLTIAVAVTAAITLYSCKKEQPDTEAQSAVDNSICEGEFTRLFGVVNDFGIKEKGIKMLERSGCPAVSADTVNKIMTIDYGTTPCMDADGKYRQGKIIAKFSNNWSLPTTKVTLTFIGYKANNVSFGCDSVVIQKTMGVAHSFTTSVYKGKCWNASWDMEWAGTRTMSQTAGANDTISSNDVFEVTGNATGKNRNGKAYTVHISVPIQKKASCNWIDKGRLDLTPEGLATRTIDYGIGTCDNDATLTINGNVYTFKLD